MTAGSIHIDLPKVAKGEAFLELLDRHSQLLREHYRLLLLLPASAFRKVRLDKRLPPSTNHSLPINATHCKGVRPDYFPLDLHVLVHNDWLLALLLAVFRPL